MGNYAGFNTVQLQRPKRSQFDLSHYKKMSTRAGRLTPVFIQECVPSDSFRGSSEILVRVAPLLAPIYDFLTLYVHFFFVPCRLLWEEWETFITGGRLGFGVDPLTQPIPPFVDIGDVLDNSPGTFQMSNLPDYLGVPIFEDLPGYAGALSYQDVTLDMMPFLAVQRVWFDFYRDRNYVTDDFFNVPFPVPSGEMAWDDAIQFMGRQDRCWEHDYFTSALPWTQRGAEVLLPMAGTGTVNYLDVSRIERSDDLAWAGQIALGVDNLATAAKGYVVTQPGGTVGASPGQANARIENIDSIDFENSTIGMNDFRAAYALQVWLERNAIGGSRYVESTQAHFGVRPQDSRLQNAEYIGGGRIPIRISEIVSTAYSQDASSVTIPLANMGGHGITYGNTNQFRYFCPEHGFIVGYASIMSPPSYHQGLPRMFKRRSFLDYPWPTFAKLGEQEVSKYELFASPANLTESGTGQFPLFGYQSRYADWKYVCTTNHGDFHDTLKFWTLVREFASSPVLGSTFVSYTESVQDRIFAVNGDRDNFWLYVHNSVSVLRPLPYFGQPNTLGFS